MPSTSAAQARSRTELEYDNYIKVGVTSSQKEKLGAACAAALAKYHASRTRKSYADRLRKGRARSRKRIAEIRQETIHAYGGRCVKCGESDSIVLVIDHINDDGHSDRKINGHHGGWSMYVKLKKAGWPKDRYQLLCHNCNSKKEYWRRQSAIDQ